MATPSGPRDRDGTITTWLRQAARGDRDAESHLLQALYDDLHRMAQRLLLHERPHHTLQPTGLVHEAYVRLLRGARISWQDRAHFFATASTAMRRSLVDHARRRSAGKRGAGETPAALEDVQEPALAHSPELILAVDHALKALARPHPRQARIVELKFFSGLTDEETGAILRVSTRTVKREWSAAKQWLYHHLGV